MCILALVIDHISYNNVQRFYLKNMKPISNVNKCIQTIPKTTISSKNWMNDAKKYKIDLFDLLYPKGTSYKLRIHGVSKHPIYNFLHTYYQYSFKAIELYSPGINIILQDAYGDNGINELVSNKYCKYLNNDVYYTPSCIPSTTKKEKQHITFLKHNHNILRKTHQRSPFFGCFGMHEWAMVYDPDYSSTTTTTATAEYMNKYKQQKYLNFRISQSIINNVVSNSNLRCTHFDAWRFFQDDARIQNKHHLERYNQEEYEQPGCIHANMDLFKCATDIYPLIPSTLLLSCLELAINSRTIDMRASPYDVSSYSGCEDAIEIETNIGRQLYIKEQEKIYQQSIPIRHELLMYYDEILQY